MEIILHRVNEINTLINSDQKYGVEIDLRSINKLIIHHDPFSKNNEDFEKWLSFYKHGTLIINIKEEGLENEIIKKLDKYDISNFFFLDQSFPFLILKNKIVKKRTALRFSEFETIDTIIKSYNYANWIWIDCFTKYPQISFNKMKILKQKYLFKTCLVSPELQGHDMKKFVQKNKTLIKNYQLDAVCTRNQLFKKFK